MSRDGAKLTRHALMPIPSAIATALPEPDGRQDLIPQCCRELRSESVIPSSVEVIHMHDGRIIEKRREGISEGALATACPAIDGYDSDITDKRRGLRGMFESE